MAKPVKERTAAEMRARAAAKAYGAGVHDTRRIVESAERNVMRGFIIASLGEDTYWALVEANIKE